MPREGSRRRAGRLHDIGCGELEGNRRPIFVNTFYNCLATISDEANFQPLLATEIRFRACAGGSLPSQRPGNGWRASGLRHRGQPLGRADGWRDRRHDGGILIDVTTNEIVASGFSMPHSPRLYDGKLWMLNSGTGEFGTVDPADGSVHTASASVRAMRAASPSSGTLPRSGCRGRVTGRAFSGLALDERLAAEGRGRAVWRRDRRLRTGNCRRMASLRAHDRGALRRRVRAGRRAAEAIGFRSDEIERDITIE